MDKITRNNGSALLSALFIMTLCALIAVAMSAKFPMDIFRTKLIINDNHEYFAMQLVEFWAMDYLSQQELAVTAHLNDKNGKITKFPDKLNIYPDIKLEGAIYDLQARFNINSLRDSKRKRIFINLLQNVIPEITEDEAKRITSATRSFILAYKNDKTTQELDNFYKGLKPNYIPANQTMKSISEFRLVKDVSNKYYNSLLPFIIALPEITHINVNTASAKLLKSLGDNITDEQIGALIKARGDKGFENTQIMKETLKNLKIPTSYTTIDSEYFLCIIKSTNKDSLLTKFVILKRNKEKKTFVSTIISEYSNGL